MPTTRIFKSGNSQAVRIPKELQFERMDILLEIERHGDALILRPQRRSMRETLVRFLALGPSPDFPDRQPQTQHDREPL
ncbi:MAG: type II toxin-antitoxin system VapB family antitoxin [Beggiatoa sp.]|jgi:antitoxin VapB|nr:type II toxin-antitoxin system VapB family antitoxin [Beggiatoa sp.]